MNRQRLKVELILEGPILTQSSAAAAPGIDAAVARNHEGIVMLPYSLVKGKILDAFRELPTNPATLRWLGAPSAHRDFDPERGRLSFTDFVTNTPERKTDDHDGVIERIQIDEKTGAVGRGMLAMIEATYGYGEPVTFVGHIDFIADHAEANQIKTEIEKAFDSVCSYGAMRTIGFGRKQSHDRFA